MTGQVAAMKEYFDRSTRALEEADSTFSPKDGMFTVAQQIAHAAQTVDWFFEGAFAEGGFSMDFENMDKEVRQVSSLAAAKRTTKAITTASKAAGNGARAATFPIG